MTRTQQEPRFFSEKKNGDEEKEITSKKKSSSSSSKKTNKTNKKAATTENEKNQSKKYKLTQDIASSDSDDENLSLHEFSDEEFRSSPASPTKSNDESGEDDENQEPISRKRKGGKHDENDEPMIKKRKMGKKKEKKEYRENDDDDDLPYGWDPRREASTKNINFKTWQMAHSTREMYFFGPDNYIYPNASTMKKFIDAIQRNEIEEAMVNTPVMPMKKIVGTNPPMSIGITGLRYLSGGGSFNVTPQIYIAKAYQSEYNQTSGFKLIKIHMPLSCLENIKECFNQLSAYLEEHGVKKSSNQ